MANNTHINKIIYGTSTLVDLTEDTVTPKYMYKGITAHMADGSTTTGNAEVSVYNTKLIMPEYFIDVVTTSDDISPSVQDAIIISKTITENGTYNAASDSADGYNPIIVNVGGGSANVWGEITGTLSNQIDLVEALSTKANVANLGNLSSMDTISYTSNYITNKPSLGTLASMDTISYTSNYITNKPILGTMAAINDASSDNEYYVRRNGSWTTLPVYTGSVT